MTFPRMGLTIVGVLAVGVMGCPEPTKKRNVREPDGGEMSAGRGGGSALGGRGGGSGGSTSNGGSGGGSAGSGSGGSGGSAGRDAGSGMAGAGGTAGRDAGTAGRDGGGATPDGRPPADGPADGGMVSAQFLTIYDTIFKAKCGSACHIGAGSASGGLAMPNAAAALANLVNKDSSCMGVKRVLPTDPTKSMLVTILKYAAATGNTPPVAGCTRTNRMPKGGAAALTMPEIKMIEDWITAGAK